MEGVVGHNKVEGYQPGLLIISLAEVCFEECVVKVKVGVGMDG